MNNTRFPCVIVNTALKKTCCCQVTKAHVVDFEQLRAWILYSERRSYVNYNYHMLCPFLTFN